MQERLKAQGGQDSDVYALTGNRRLAAARQAKSKVNARFATQEELDSTNLDRDSQRRQLEEVIHMSDKTSRRIPIVTEVGELRGRDAVYLDRAIQTCAPSSLQLEGQLNARLCTSYSGSREWLPYELEFKNVAAYECFLLHLYSDEQRIESSLDIVPNSSWLEQLRLPASTHYVVATYDHVYEVAATSIALRLSPGRQ